MSVVLGTAGHIDHGKTTLLAALTGIDADRLPEERRRGMTIDVGYAHLALADGRVIDFVDVPGHDRLIGNMLVGAGEIDAALLVIAADDGPRAQTLEHLAILHALGIDGAVVALTKTDLADAERVAAVRATIAALLAPTRLAGSPVIGVSARTGDGLPELRDALAALAARTEERIAAEPVTGARLAVDRRFAVRGRGLVVTGSLRGGPLATGELLRLVPGEGSVRIRELQVRGSTEERALRGRVAGNVAAAEDLPIGRGSVLTHDPAVVASDRLLVAIEAGAALPEGETRPGRRSGPLPPDGAILRLHAATAETGARVGRSGRDDLLLADGAALAVLRLDAPIAAAPGDRILLRRPSPAGSVAGAVILDPTPPRGISRRRQDPERVAALAAAVASGDRSAIGAATLDLHGARIGPDGATHLAPDLLAAGMEAAIAAVAAYHRSQPGEVGIPPATLRPLVARPLRRLATLPGPAATAAADRAIEAALAEARMVRDAGRIRLPGHAAAGPDPALLAAMDRLEAALGVVAPPALSAAARAVDCPPEGIRALERSGRIVVVAPELAWSAARYRELAARALVMAHAGPLTPAAYRDATGTSRKYVLAILEDLDRRGILRRTDAGHLPGPKAPPLPGR